MNSTSFPVRTLRCLANVAFAVGTLLAAPAAQGPSADELLAAWLAVRDGEQQYTKLQQYTIAAELAPPSGLSDAMRRFADKAPIVDDGAVDELLQAVRGARQTFASTHPFLPWLLLVEKARPDDPRVLLCIAEAWATGPDGVRNTAAAKAAVETLQTAIRDEGGGAGAIDKLAKFATELESFDPKDGCAGWFAARLAATASALGKDDGLSPGWLIRARLADLEGDFVAAIRGNGKDPLAVVAAMQALSPEDPTYALLYVLVAESAGREVSTTSQASSFRDKWKALERPRGGITRGTVSDGLRRLGVRSACAKLGVSLDDNDPSKLASAVRTATKRGGLFPTTAALDSQLASANSVVKGYRDTLDRFLKRKEELAERRRVLQAAVRNARTRNARIDANNRLRECEEQIEKNKNDISKKEQDINDKTKDVAAIEAERARVGNYSLDS